MFARRMLATVLVAVFVGSFAAPRRAEACGGCFAPPGAVQTVTGHRMVFALSTTQTTLWDQFSYAGNPADFSWILPIHFSPEVSVRLADDRFMRIMDNTTAPVLTPPQRPYRYCSTCDRFFGGTADAGSANDARVVVHREEVVGPYAIAIIGGSDPMEVRNWLRDNGFAVPPAVVPIIDHYTAMHSDYLAVRLRSSVGVSRMTPIRITMPGYQPVLPLRMIAAGVSDSVDLSLIVVSAGRIEAQNFPNGEIRESDLTYDFDHATEPAQDFLAEFRRLNALNSGRLWLTEVSTRRTLDDYMNFAQGAISGQPSDGGFCPDASTGDTGSVDAAEDAPSTLDVTAMDPDAMTGACREPDPRDDVEVAFRGLGSSAQITRMRASLSPSGLDRDLQLQAGPSTDRAREYRYGHILHMPPEPPPCPPTPTDCGYNPWDPRDAGPDVTWARGLPYGGGGGCSPGAARCSVNTRGASGGGLAALLMVSGLAIVRRRRSRRSRA